MQRDSSLQVILNGVAAAIETCIPSVVQPADELDAFILCDELLASLHKEYLDAKACRIRAREEYGAHDGMTDMAELVEDSAWCAMQTRYMELRENKIIQKKASVLLSQARETEERERRATEEESAARLAQYLFTLMRAQKNFEDARKDDTPFLMLLWWILSGQAQAAPMFREVPAWCFNRIAA